MSAQDKIVMEDENYVKVAQLYGIMKKVENNNSMAFERLLDKCDEPENLQLIMEHLLKDTDINYRVPASNFLKSKMPHLIGSTLLHLAAEKDDIEMFDMFIKKGANFTIKNQNESTVVHQMIYKSPSKKYFDRVTDESQLEQDPFVELVLAAHIEYKIPINPCDKYGVSHFSVACMTNNVKAVEFFLEQGVSLDETVGKDSKQWPGYTPLHFAAKYCSVEVTEILLSRDANPNVKDSRGMTPLQLLLEEKMKIWRKKTRMMAIGLSDEVDRYSSLALLLEKNEKISKMLLLNQRTIADEIAFYAVCTMKDSAMVEYFLDSNVVDLDRAIASDSPFYPGYTAAHFAAHFNVETVKLLVKKGANMIVRDAKGVTPFDICFQGFKVEDLYSLIMSRSEWSDITFLNGKTRLSTFINAMREPFAFESYLRQNLTSMYTYVRLDSPVCAGYTPLHLAVACTETCPSNWENRVIRLPRYLDRIEKCLSLGADVTAEDGDGLTSVHRAFRLCENQVVSRLLQCQTRVFNPVDGDGLSHFHIACIVNHKDLIEKLIDSGVGVNIPIASSYKWYEENSHSESYISCGSTPLHFVADSSNLAMTKLMLKHDANVFAKDSDGLTAVERAVKRDRPGDLDGYSIIRKLIGTSKHKVFNVTRDFDALSELLHRIPEHFTLGSLIKDDKKNHGRIIVDQTMLECVFKKMGLTMLHLVCYSSTETSQIRELLDNEADINAKVNEDSPVYPGYTPLHFAVKYLRMGLQYESDVDLRMVNFLLSRGADVTIPNCRQQTPIHQAFELILSEIESNYIIVDTLLKGQKDYSINPKDARGLSHFHMACYRNKKNVVNEFLNKGVNVNQSIDHFVNEFGGYSPLHFAMIRPNKKVYSLLLKHGADVNAKDRLGNNPLHVAVKCGKWSNDQFFSSVLRAGADPNAKNLMHESVLERLLMNEKVTLKPVASFNRHGARINVINPISHEGYLTQAVRTLHHDKSIFHEVAKFSDVMDADENGFNVFHNIVAEDYYPSRGYSSFERNFDDVERWSLPTEAEAIEILAKQNLNIDSKNKQGKTALQFAIENVNIDGIIGLLWNGADINTEIDASGKTSFTYIVDVINSQKPTETKGQGIIIVSDYAKSSDILMYRILSMHVHKLLFAKIYVSEANKNAYLQARRTFHLDNIDVYKAELEKLAKQQVGSSSLTLRHFLSETGVVASYAHMLQPERQEINEFFSDNGLESLYKRFPVMTSLLKLQYHKALARVELLSRAAEALNLVLGFNFPVLCSDALMRFLTNEELKNIIASEVVM